MHELNSLTTKLTLDAMNGAAEPPHVTMRLLAAPAEASRSRGLLGRLRRAVAEAIRAVARRRQAAPIHGRSMNGVHT